MDIDERGLTPWLREQEARMLAMAKALDGTRTCAHCGQVCGDYEGGYGAVTADDGTLLPLCHPNAPGRPDCYRRVTVYHESLGALLDADPKPDRISGIVKEPDRIRSAEVEQIRAEVRRAMDAMGL